MARVDRAELVGSDGGRRPVALKRMLPHVAANEDMVQAFLREARLASHLRHANVAQTYEFGQVDGVHFIAMELVTGPDLRAVLKHCAQTTGPMPVPIALNLLNQICDALDYAHNLRDETGRPLGIIHRDVSPSNIIVDPAGVVKLIDFGIAKASTAGVQTVAGVVKGKFGYMAPEYLLGRIDARADLFAIGVIAHELLTNRPLFSTTDDMETLRRLRTMPLVPPSRGNPNVPPEIDGIVLTALAREPDQRWQHATALRTALTTLTQRLGLVCSNRQVVEWIAWAFEQTGLPAAKRPADAVSVYDLELSYSHLQIEESTHAELTAGAGAAASTAIPTLRISGPPPPPSPRSIGTPARAITAQPAIPSAGPHRPGRAAPGDPPSPGEPTRVGEPTMIGEPTILGMPGELRARAASVPPIPPPEARALPPPIPAPPFAAPPKRAPSAGGPIAGAAPERSHGALRIAVLVLLTAGLAAAGVYAALLLLT